MVKKYYLVEGCLSSIALQVSEFCQAYSKQQALLLINKRLQKRHPHLVIPPVGLHCEVKEVKPPRRSSV